MAGVAGGLAAAIGVAPLWTRLGFVVLSLFDGLGVAAYLAGFLLLPSGPVGPAPRLARRILGLFHAERCSGRPGESRTQMVARLELGDFTDRMNDLVAIEREVRS